MPRFSIQEGYRITGEFEIPEGVSVIGRHPEASLPLTKHPGVSREHCRIVNQAGVVTVEDLQSRNGTFLNGKPLDAMAELRHNDYLQIDNVLLLYSALDVMPSSRTDVIERSETTSKLSYVQEVGEKLRKNIVKVIQGKDEVVRLVVIALFSDGHVLLEDVPGVGKTKLAQALAKSVNTNFKRIQFTPDMLPNDITGVNVFDESTGKFVFMPGPIFSNVVLADEINRGTPRVQSALLECMSESRITVDGSSYILHKPFFVIATQNPVDFHGTYPLPEAQLDRFLMRLSLGYLDPESEKLVLERQAMSNPLVSLSSVIESSDLLHCQSLVQKVHVSEAFRDYVVTLVNRTREHETLAYGCSTRASLALLRASQAQAALEGRDHVLPRDARDLALYVLPHRMQLRVQARATWRSTSAVLEEILGQLPMSRWE